MQQAYLLVTTTVNSEQDAVRIARKIVGLKLGRCVQIIPRVRSIYHWDGEICDDDEFLIIVKTREDNLKALMENLSRWHPYDLPEILAVPVCAGYEPYLKWLDEWKYNDSQ